MAPSPPISANSLSKSTNPNDPSASTSAQRSATEHSRPGQSSTASSNGSGNGNANPGSSAATGAGNGIGARPAGNNPVSSLAGAGTNLRPSYSPFGARDTQTRDPPKPSGYGAASTASRPSEPPSSAGGASTASSTTSASQSHPGGPHHHHHHHHHHAHAGSAQPASSTAAPGSTSQSATTASAATAAAKPAPTYSHTGMWHSMGARGMTDLESLRARERERAEREAGRTRVSETESQRMAREREILRARGERERLEDARRVEAARRERDRKEQEAKAAAPATSPRTALGSAAYSRPSLPPSPTNSRNLPPATSASPANSAKPSPLPSSASATGSTQRPNLPLPSLSSIGGRSLPSPFDQQRAATTAGQPANAAHRRTPSGGSGVRPDAASLGMGQTSPGKPAATQPAPSRSMFGTTGFGGIRDTKPTPSPAPSTQPASRDPVRPASAASTAAKPAAAATTASARPPPGRDFYGNYSSYGGGFMPFSGGFDYNSFGGWGGSRRPLTEREQKDQREYAEERKRIAEEQEARKAREREQREQQAKREEELRASRLQQQVEQQKQRLKDQARERERELDAQVAAQKKDYYTARGFYQSPPKPNTALAQVAPRREPRPYEYKTEARDYSYTPREKRPRMDAAVDEARRGNATKTKRRKDEERPKSPGRNRDLLHLGEAVRKWPEVTSAAVEAWLKTVGDLNRIVATETYSGVCYRMSQHRKRNTLGGIVQVRIGGGFLGANWKLRGAPGWDEASSTPIRKEDGTGQGEGQVCAGWSNRGVWGTDVYTDDSDLGLVLVHAGWIKWGGPQSGNLDRDCVVVDVRIVPPLLRYTATERNGMRTRGWGNGHDGSSIVIEAVRRVAANQSMFTGRKSRKERLAEYALERQAVFAVPPPSHTEPSQLDDLEDETPEHFSDGIKRVNGVMANLEPFLIMGRDGFTYKYTPDALEDYLVRDDDEEEEQEEEKGAKAVQADSLWTRDLELQHGANRYRLSLLPSDVECPLLRLVHTPLRAISTPQDQNKRTTVFDELPASNLLWYANGLVYQSLVAEADTEADGEGKVPKTKKMEAKLCRVNGYRWIERENGWKPEKVVKLEMEVDQ